MTQCPVPNNIPLRGGPFDGGFAAHGTIVVSTDIPASHSWAWTKDGHLYMLSPDNKVFNYVGACKTEVSVEG